jgi:hypothetical protein
VVGGSRPLSADARCVVGCHREAQVKEAGEHVSRRKYAQALPLLERAVDIVESSMGPASQLAEGDATAPLFTPLSIRL